MANMLFANNCNTTLASSLTSGATSMSVTSATGFPSPTGVQYFYCTLADAATQTTIEIVKVTAVSGTTFTIVRGQDGTSGTAFASGAVVSLRLVRASLNDFPKLDENNTFTNGFYSTGSYSGSFTDGIVTDYTTGTGRFSVGTSDGFAWYNGGVATTSLMALSSSGVLTGATWNGATIGTGNGGTGLTSFTSGGVLYASSTSAIATGSGLQFNGSTFGVGVTPQTWLAGGWKAQQIGTAMSFADAGNGFNFYGNNIYLDASSVYRYLVSSGAGTYQQGNGTHTWNTAPSGTAGGVVTLTEAMRISISGGVSISNTTDPGVGNLRFADTSHGIYFGSSSLLSDYEEGTWTPSVTPQGGSLTSYTATGSYKKVGRIASVHAKIVINTAGTSTGQMQISNFPYACATGFYPTGNAIEVAIIGGYFNCYINAGGVAGAISSVSWGNGYTYNLSITYETQ